MDTRTVSRKIELADKKLTLKMRDGIVLANDLGIQPMRDSTSLYAEGKFTELWDVLQKDGYVLIRQALPSSDVMKARIAMLKHLAVKGAVKPPADGDWSRHDGSIVEELVRQPGWTVDAESGGFVDGREADTAIEGWHKLGMEVKKLFHGKQLLAIYEKLFGSSFVACPDCTWLRVMPCGGQTIVHADYYYFRTSTDLFSRNAVIPSTKKSAMCEKCKEAVTSKPVRCVLCRKSFHPETCSQELPQGEYHCSACANSPFDLFTCWIPLGSYTPLNGVLAVVPGSHTLQGFDTPAKTRVGKPLVPAEYPLFAQRQASLWHTTSVQPGDLILFNIKTMHAATKNTVPCYRLSCDTRVAARPFDCTTTLRVASIYQKKEKKPPQTWICLWPACLTENTSRFCKTCCQPRGSQPREKTRTLRNTAPGSVSVSDVLPSPKRQKGDSS